MSSEKENYYHQSDRIYLCSSRYIGYRLYGFMSSGILKKVLIVIFSVLTVFLLGITIWCWLLYRAFDYNGKRQMSKQIIDGTAAYN